MRPRPCYCADEMSVTLLMEKMRPWLWNSHAHINWSRNNKNIHNMHNIFRNRSISIDRCHTYSLRIGGKLKWNRKVKIISNKPKFLEIFIYFYTVSPKVASIQKPGGAAIIHHVNLYLGGLAAHSTAKTDMLHVA